MGSRVVDSSLQQLIPGSANSNVVLSHTTVYKVADSTSLGINLTGGISGNIGDVVTQTRAVDPWQANTNIAVGQLTYYSGNSYTVTGNVYGSSFANITSNVALAFPGNQTNIATMILLETVADATVIPVVLTSGTIFGAPIRFDSGKTSAASGTYDHGSTDPEYSFGPVSTWQPNTVLPLGKYTYYSGNSYTVTGNVYGSTFASIAGNVSFIFSGNTGQPPYNQPITYTGGGEGFDNTVGTIYVNGVDSGVYLKNYYILGKVDSLTQVTVPTGTRVSQSNVWYSPGLGIATNGLSLSNSNTAQANFLKASPGFSPTPGTTP